MLSIIFCFLLENFLNAPAERQVSSKKHVLCTKESNKKREKCLVVRSILESQMKLYEDELNTPLQGIADLRNLAISLEKYFKEAQLLGMNIDNFTEQKKELDKKYEKIMVNKILYQYMITVASLTMNFDYLDKYEQEIAVALNRAEKVSIGLNQAQKVGVDIVDISNFEKRKNDIDKMLRVKLSVNQALLEYKLAIEHKTFTETWQCSNVLNTELKELESLGMNIESLRKQKREWDKVLVEKRLNQMLVEYKLAIESKAPEEQDQISEKVMNALKIGEELGVNVDNLKQKKQNLDQNRVERSLRKIMITKHNSSNRTDAILTINEEKLKKTSWKQSVRKIFS